MDLEGNSEDSEGFLALKEQTLFFFYFAVDREKTTKAANKEVQ